MPRFATSAIFAVLTMAVFSAFGQVIKCTDPRTGRITFSDSPCATGQSSVEVQPRRTPEEMQEERLRAEEANNRKQRQLDQQMLDRQRAAELAATAPVTAAPDRQVNPANSNACTQAQRDLETIASSITGSEELRRNRINAATVRVNATCGLQTEMIQPPHKIVVAPPRFRPVQPLPQPLPRPIPQGSRTITGCDGGICRDAQGGLYHRNGPNFMTGPNGATCHKNGPQWVCN